GRPGANGFVALQYFDSLEAGGNNNGVIDAGDSVFQQSRIWIDRGRRGVSKPGELVTLSEAGVDWISIHPTLSRRVDQFGNSFRYRAPVGFDVAHGRMTR